MTNDDVFYELTERQERELQKQIALKQSKERQREEFTQPRLLSLPQLVPVRSCGERINERFEYILGKVQCPNLSRAAVWKVARAIEEKRIEEHRIASIFPRLEIVSNRGAYFLACAKGAFKAVDLSWFEEEWEDA